VLYKHATNRALHGEDYTSANCPPIILQSDHCCRSSFSAAHETASAYETAVPSFQIL